jgi:hypothetical protein
MQRPRSIREAPAPVLSTVTMRNVSNSVSVHYQLGELRLSGYAYTNGNDVAVASLHRAGVEVENVDLYPGHDGAEPFVAVGFTQGPRTKASKVDVFLDVAEALALRDALNDALAKHHQPSLIPDGVELRHAEADS